MLLRNILRAIIGFRISSLHVKIAPPPTRMLRLTFRTEALEVDSAAVTPAAGANATTVPQRVCGNW